MLGPGLVTSHPTISLNMKGGLVQPKNIQGNFSGTPEQWDPFTVSFPYYSHIFMDSYGSGMGRIWETSHKGVPLLGVPENPTEISTVFKPCAVRRPLPETNKHDRLNMVGGKMIVSKNGAILGPFFFWGGRCLLVLGKVMDSIYHLERIDGWQHKMYSVRGGDVG